MLTEFNGGDFNNPKDNYEEAVLEADNHMISWAYWEFKDFCVQNHTTEF